MKSTSIGRQAVVVGAGMGGLPAARVLADFFEHVVVLERDTLPLDASHRNGIPQGRHTHALLAGGQQALADLFPGFEQDLAVGGAVPVETGLDLRFERPGFDPPPTRDLGLVVRAMCGMVSRLLSTRALFVVVALGFTRASALCATPPVPAK